jgi:cytochrome c556
MKKMLIPLIAGALSVALAGGAMAADDPVRKAQELRQAPMKLIGNNFGFMNAMAKGDIPWNAGEFQARGRELGAIGQLDLMRGYAPDSYEGKTRAKPDVGLEIDDFEEKMQKFEAALRDFGGMQDADSMRAKIGDLGENCKGCHKKYKSKEYQD